MGRKRIYETEKDYLAAQEKSKKRWRENNQQRVAYIRAKSAAKKFVSLSDDDDLEMLEEWLNERKRVLDETESKN